MLPAMTTMHGHPGPHHVDRLERGHPFRQWKSWTIPGTRLTLQGYSRANDKTFFHLPELACCIDAGLCEGRSVDTVFLTHTHHDHSYDIDYLATAKDGRVVYAPRESIELLERYIRNKGELNFHAPYDPALASKYELRGVESGDTFTFGKRDAWQVRVVRCLHKVPCVGYCFAERQTRYLPDIEARRVELFAAGAQQEFGKWLAAQRKAGVIVQEEFFAPRFAFVGDTSPDVFAREPWLFDYPVIITECTFLDDAQRERAHAAGHTLWSELRPIIAAHPEHTFVLVHFSLRHSDREVIEFFGRPENRLDNIVLWAHPDSLLAEQHQSG